MIKEELTCSDTQKSYQPDKVDVLQGIRAIVQLHFCLVVLVLKNN